MVIVDTSVWIDHFQKYNDDLANLLNESKVAIHNFIIGELACGNFKNRTLVLSLFKTLPSVPIISQEEYLHFIESNKLYGTGLGFVDIHILASAFISKSIIYTRDRSLFFAAKRFKLSYKEEF